MSKPAIQFSRAWFIFFLVFGSFVFLFGIYNVDPLEFAIFGPLIIGMGFYYRKMSNTFIYPCHFCKSPLLEQSALTCSKCGKDQPETKKEVA